MSTLFLFFFNDTATTEIYTLSYTTLFRSRPQPELGVDPVRPDFRRPIPGLDSAQCGHGADTVPDHRGARGARRVLPEGVLPQRLHQEPQAARPLLQHARPVRLPGDVRALPARHDRKREL